MKGSYLALGVIALFGLIFLERRNTTTKSPLSTSGQATVNGVTGIATGVVSVVDSIENMFKRAPLPGVPQQSNQIYVPQNAPISTDLVAPSPAPMLTNTDSLPIGALPTDALYDTSGLMY